MHPLLARARKLSRRIYASLPWGYRLAGVMLHIASILNDLFGRAVYQEFIRLGVVGMPPLNGEVPSRDLKRVPAGYGKKFADRLYALLLTKSRNPDIAEDVMSEVLKKLGEGKLTIREGAVLREAEQYVTQTAMNILKTLWRTKSRHPEESFPSADPDAEEGPQVNFEDPNSFRHLDKLLPKADLGRLMHDLERVHDRAPSWLEAKLDGLTGVEIAQEWGVGKSAITAWEQKNVPEIKRVLTRYIQDAA